MDEHLGKFTLHFVAYQTPDGRWDPFVTVESFDEASKDFVVLVDRHPAPPGMDNYEEAMAAARAEGHRLVRELQSGGRGS